MIFKYKLLDYLVRKVVHPLSNCIKSVKNKHVNMNHTGNDGVSRRLQKYIRLDRKNTMKLEKSQVQWIVREKIFSQIQR